MDVEAAYEFSSPDLSDSLILGFFGTHNNFLLSIGVISKKVRYDFTLLVRQHVDLLINMMP